MNKRGINLMLLVLAMVLVLCPLQASASETCEHEWGTWNAFDAPADCENGGYERRYCIYCDEYEQRYVPATGHIWGDWVEEWPATCAEEGNQYRHCTVCGEYEEERIPVDSSNHSWEGWYTEREATCTEDGLKYRICYYCDAREEEAIPNLGGHAWGNWYNNDGYSCLEDHYLYRQCSRCWEKESLLVEAVAEHAWNEWQPEETDYCIKDEEFRTCANCTRRQTRAVESYGEHTWGVWDIFRWDDSCGNYWAQRKCKDCWASESDFFLGAEENHTWGEWETYTSFTCVEAHQERRICDTCNYAEYRDAEIYEEHDWTEWAARSWVSYNCLDGYTEYRDCLRCKTTESRAVEPAEEHVWGEWQPNTTYCVVDQEYRQCVNCTQRQTKNVEAYGEHTYEKWEIYQYSAYCGNYWARSECTVCGSTTSRHFLGAEENHTWGAWRSEGDVSCTEEHREYRHCDTCGNNEYRDAAAAEAHTWSEWQWNNSEPGCGRGAYRNHRCVVCNEYESEFVEATGNHEWGDWYVDGDYSCLHGYTQYRCCNYCDTYEYQDVAPVAEHVWTDWQPYSGGCVVSQEYRECVNCNQWQRRELEESYGEHTWGEWDIYWMDATCGNYWATNTCTVCGGGADQYFSGDNHTWSQWWVEGDVSCLEDHWEYRHCDACGNNESREVPAAEDHNWGEWLVDRPANCLETGINVRDCMSCNQREWEEVPQDENVHNWSDWHSEDMNCEVDYTNYRWCHWCGKDERVLVEANGTHVWSDWMPNEGCVVRYEYRVCENCPQEQSRDLEEPYGEHTWDNWEPMHYDSCGGCWEYTTCTVCGDHTDRYVEGNDHTYEEGYCIRCHAEDPDYVFLQIRVQPNSVLVEEGELAFVSVGVWGDAVKWEWYFANAGSSVFHKTDSFTDGIYAVVMNEARNGRRVYCVVTDSKGNQVQTDVVTLRMKTPALAILKQPSSIAVEEGEVAFVQVQAAGAVKYEWYFCEAGSSKFHKTNSFKGNTYAVVMNEVRNGRRIYCVVTDAEGNQIQSDVVTISMTSGLKITKQPVSVTVAEGATAKVTVTAEGEGLTYKWYYKDAGDSKFYLTNSFKSNTYSVAMTAARNGRQVYCVITDKYGNEITTDVATLSMKASGPVITKQPQSVAVANGETAKVTVTAEGEGLTYKWYFKDVGDSKFYLTNTFKGSSYSITMTAARSGRQVYCVITDKNGNSVQTETVTLLMKGSGPVITVQPVSVTVAEGATAKVTVTAEGEGLTYKWYYKDVGDSKFYLTNTFKGNSYSVQMTAARSGRQVYCVITDKDGNSVQTDTVTLKMK